MAETRKFICGNCGSENEIVTKKGGGSMEATLWLITIFLGIFYSIWRRMKPKKNLPILWK